MVDLLYKLVVMWKCIALNAYFEKKAKTIR